MDAKSDGVDGAEVWTADGSKMEKTGKSSDETTIDGVASVASIDVGSAVAVVGPGTTEASSFALLLGFSSPVFGLGTFVGAKENVVAPVPIAPVREIPSPVEIGTAGTSDEIGLSVGVSEAGIVGSTGLTEVSSLEEGTASLVSVGTASTPDFTEETRSPISVRMAPTSEPTDDTMLAIAEGASMTSDRMEDIGRRSGRDAAAVLSGKSVVEVISKLAVTGISASSVSVGWARVRDTVGFPELDPSVVLITVKDGMGSSSDTAVVSMATVVSTSSEVVVDVSVGSSSSRLEEIGVSVIVGSILAPDGRFRVRVCDSAGVSVASGNVDSLLVRIGTSELVSAVEIG